LDALARIAEDPRLDRQKDPVARGELAGQGTGGRMAAPQIVTMAAAARAVQILMSGSTEAVHDIESTAASRVRGHVRKGDDAERLPGAWNTKALNRDRRQGGVGSSYVWFGASREDGHIVTRTREFVNDLPRDIFDSANTRREAFDYDCDAQCGNPLALSREYPLRLVLASES